MALMQTKNLSIGIGEKQLCQNLNIQINVGETWGILGRNGCGKSTLLHTLAGLLKPVTGEIFFIDKSYQQLTRQSIAKHLAILFQDYEDPFPSSVLETVLLGRHPHLTKWQWESAKDYQLARKAIELMQLTDYEQRCITQLSGGERRRVAIATVLTQNPDLFLLDEPTSHLDVNHQIHVLNHFQYLATQTKKAIVMVLHDINLAARYCDHVLLLFDDNKYLAGKKSELLNEDLLSQLYKNTIRELATDNGKLWLAI